jgi:hypothetical protein
MGEACCKNNNQTIIDENFGTTTVSPAHPPAMTAISVLTPQEKFPAGETKIANRQI